MSDKPNGQASPILTNSAQVFVATPAYDGKVDTDFAQSIAETMWFCGARVLMEHPLININACFMGNGAFIELARNVFVKMFLEQDDLKDCTHLFFVDADLKWEARAFAGLVDANLPICAGVYPRRQDPIDYPFKWMPHPEIKGPNGEDTLWIDDRGWLMCSRVPTGFLCIRRDVLEEMAAEAQWLNVYGHEGGVPWLFETKIDEQRRFVGEDYAFSDKYVQKYDQPIPVWMDFDFTHGGKWEGNLLHHLDAEVKAYQEATGERRKLGKRTQKTATAAGGR
jgi:hypothetical protein